MVTGVLSLTRNGLRDWIIQRVSAVILGLYFLVIALFVLLHPQMHYLQWTLFIMHPWMRIFSLLALLSLAAHAWVGVWTILTDYVKPAWLRGSLQVIIILALVACVFWGIEIIWGLF